MELSQIVLGIVGAILSLVFSYLPAAKNWYDVQDNKGLLMLGFCVVVGGGYFALGCWPFAAMLLKIAVSCDVPGAFALIQAIIAIAVGNQLAFLFTRKGRAAELRRSF